MKKTMELLSAFKQAMDGHEIKIIVYFRRQDRAVKSRLSQSVKGIMQSSILSSNFAFCNDSNLNYYEFLKGLYEIFKKENVLHIDYDYEAKANNLVKGFFDKVGISTKGLDIKNGGSNKGLSKDSINIIKKINELPIKFNESIRIIKAFEYLASQGLDCSSSEMLSPEENKKIFYYFKMRGQVVFENWKEPEIKEVIDKTDEHRLDMRATYWLINSMMNEIQLLRSEISGIKRNVCSCIDSNDHG